MHYQPRGLSKPGAPPSGVPSAPPRSAGFVASWADDLSWRWAAAHRFEILLRSRPRFPFQRAFTVQGVNIFTLALFLSRPGLFPA